MIIDIHCHVPRSPFLQDIEEWTKRWKVANVVSVGSMAMNMHQSRVNLDLALNHDILIPGVGIHPWKIKRSYTEEEKEFIRSLAMKAGMLGEIGLDYHFVKDPDRYPFQREFLEYILRIADDLKKPTSIHCVGAEWDLHEIVLEVGIDPALLSFHWYSGSEEFLRKFSSMGCYFSLNPALKRSIGHQKVLRLVSQSQWLTESDGNVKYDGVMGDPTLVASVVIPTIAELTGRKEDEIRALVFENFKRFIRG